MTETRVRKVESQADGFAHQGVEDAVARERSHIARELHDGIATDLAGAISLFKVYMEGKKGQPDENLKNVFEILERLLKHVRETLADLRPAGIGPDGLVGDLRSQADEFARLYGIRVELSNNGTEDQLSPHQRDVLPQVLPHTLTNLPPPPP